MRQITKDQPEKERARWSVIRLDSMTALPGLIVQADEADGTATMQEPRPDGKTEDVPYTLGLGGLVIVPKR